MFSVYKAYLKRFDGEDWVRRHELALGAVTPKKARNFFRKCGVPGDRVLSKKANVASIQNTTAMILLASEFNLI